MTYHFAERGRRKALLWPDGRVTHIGPNVKELPGAKVIDIDEKDLPAAVPETEIVKDKVTGRLTRVKTAKSRKMERFQVWRLKRDLLQWAKETGEDVSDLLGGPAE